MSGRGPDTLLLGPLSLDVYLDGGDVLPGGGALNMAWHWRRSGMPFHLITRIGDDRPDAFLAFLERHGIPHSAATIVGRGPSAAIDIVIRPDRQPFMDHYVEGVWTTFRLEPAEEALLDGARRLHLVMVEGAIRELERLSVAGRTAHLEVTADFLGFRHYTLDRLAATMRAVDVGFIGWPGSPSDPEVAGIREVAHDLGRLIVVTFGSQGVRILDGRAAGRVALAPGRDATAGDREVPVHAVGVRGTTLGCGDAFIAGFLEAWRTTGDVVAAVERGKVLGAAATRWRRPLPASAYRSAASGRRRPGPPSSDPRLTP